MSRAPAWLTARPIAHRGLHDRARGIIENMPSAIDAAVAGNFAIEVDLQLSADGEAMQAGPLSEPFRPWNAHRAYSREARGLRSRLATTANGAAE